MSSAESVTETDRREFRTRVSWAALVAWWWVFAVLLWGWARITLEILVSRYWLSEDLPAWLSPVTPGRVMAFCIAVASLLTFGAARAYLLDARRALILVTSDSIIIKDRRGRAREIPWGEIRELRLDRGEAPVLRPRLSLRTSTTTVRLPSLIVEQELLRAEVVARAHLTELEKGWIRSVYRRAGGG